jgi:hypothetical protein
MIVELVLGLVGPQLLGLLDRIRKQVGDRGDGHALGIGLGDVSRRPAPAPATADQTHLDAIRPLRVGEVAAQRRQHRRRGGGLDEAAAGRGGLFVFGGSRLVARHRGHPFWSIDIRG